VEEAAKVGSNLGNSKLLYISGSIGMGHVTRDLAIIKEIRKLRPDCIIECLAGEPAASVLRNAGYMLAPECSSLAYQADGNLAEGMAKDYRLDLYYWLYKAIKGWKETFRIYLKAVERGKYDLVVGDEAYDVIMGYMQDLRTKNVCFIMMFDFAKNYSLSWNPRERFLTWATNRLTWDKSLKKGKKGVFYSDASIFIGEPADVPDEKFGLFLGNAAESRAYYKFVGYCLDFDPKTYMDQEAMKTKLGYGSEKLIICSIGGTNVGKPLLELCAQAYPLIKEKVPGVRMVLVAGPRLRLEDLKVSEGIEVRGYVPDLYQHFAACDLAIVQGGGTTTLELTALKRPFIYFPLEGHWEQQMNVANRVQRHRAGVKMRFPKASPKRLAEVAVENLGKKVDYAEVPVDGARNAALEIARLLPKA
jgi:predicted glycosyltransferase